MLHNIDESSPDGSVMSTVGNSVEGGNEGFSGKPVRGNAEKPADGSIEGLRASIEEEHRFKTAFSGYDKKSVQDYIKKLTETFEKDTETLRKDNRLLLSERAGFLERLSEQEKQISELENRERMRNEAETAVRENLVRDLRSENRRLMEESRAKQLRITELETRISDMSRNLEEGAVSLNSLNDSLIQLLNEKIKETGHLLYAWKNEFKDTVDAVKQQL